MTPTELRRLLELAAKAGAPDGLEHDYSGYFRVIGQHEDGTKCMVRWNPADDDGDSRRLQVKLRIRHERHHASFVTAWAPDIHERFEEDEGADPCAALRLAVLRAAAAIWEAMP